MNIQYGRPWDNKTIRDFMQLSRRDNPTNANYDLVVKFQIPLTQKFCTKNTSLNVPFPKLLFAPYSGWLPTAQENSCTSSTVFWFPVIEVFACFLQAFLRFAQSVRKQRCTAFKREYMQATDYIFNALIAMFWNLVTFDAGYVTFSKLTADTHEHNTVRRTQSKLFFEINVRL